MTRRITFEEASRIAHVMRLGNLEEGFIDEFNGKIQFYINRPFGPDSAGAYVTRNEIEELVDYTRVFERWLSEQTDHTRQLLAPYIHT